MRHTVVRAAALVLPLVFAGVLFAAGGSSAAPKPIQDKGDKGKELFELVCAGCHGIDLVTSLHNSKEQWGEIVQSMVDKGAYVKKEDIPLIVDYLTLNYGVKQAPPAAAPKESPSPAPAALAPPPSTTGASLQKFVEEACSSCHGFELVAEKRASKEDWDNTVRRMVDRGAGLEADQIVPTIDYLAGKYPNK